MSDGRNGPRPRNTTTLFHPVPEPRSVPHLNLTQEQEQDQDQVVFSTNPLTDMQVYCTYFYLFHSHHFKMSPRR